MRVTGLGVVAKHAVIQPLSRSQKSLYCVEDMRTEAIRLGEPCLIPNFCAAFRSSSELCMVNIIIGRLGLIADIVRAASSPPMTGTDRSRTTRSGQRSVPISIAVFPFSASPQISQSVRFSMQERIARRKVKTPVHYPCAYRISRCDRPWHQ